MKNKKAQVGWILFGIIVAIIIIAGIFILKNVSYQHGTSKDIVQGYDKGIIWYHAYLKNDHLTAYCFDDERYVAMLEQSQQENKEVIITYKKYIGRGLLCATGNYEKVIITKMEFA